MSDQQQTEPMEADESAGATCEIGSLEMPQAEWLFAAAASFQQGYGQVHPYLAAGLCIAGTLMNLVTVLVLTRPTMRSPVNVLLCAVACCDILVEWSYLVFVLHFLLASAQRCEPSDFSWAWAAFMMFHAHASVIFHAASIWMTVSLAQIRVLTIRRATAGPATPLITERFTAILALFTTLAMALVNLPNFLTFEIMEVPASAMLSCWQPPPLAEMVPSLQQLPVEVPLPLRPETTNATLASLAGTGAAETSSSVDPMVTTVVQMISTLAPLLMGKTNNRTRRHRMKFRRLRRDIIGLSELQQQSWAEPMVYTVRAHESDCMKLKLAFWSNGMIFKVIPCLLLTLSIVALLRIIADVAHKRKNLAQVMRKKVPKDHTTPMLVAILLIFLLAELPQGVCLVLNGIFSSESFHKRVYLPLGDLMDLLSLLNSAVGFLIYVGMSRKFRTVLLQLLFAALSCLLRAELCLAPVLRPLLKRLWRPLSSNHTDGPMDGQSPGQGHRRVKPSGGAGNAAQANANGTAEGVGATGTPLALHQSLRRIRERLTLEQEFSETLRLLDTRRRSAGAELSGGQQQERKRSTAAVLGTNRPWSEKLTKKRSGKATTTTEKPPQTTTSEGGGAEQRREGQNGDNIHGQLAKRAAAMQRRAMSSDQQHQQQKHYGAVRWVARSPRIPGSANANNCSNVAALSTSGRTTAGWRTASFWAKFGQQSGKNNGKTPWAPGLSGGAGESASAAGGSKNWRRTSASCTTGGPQSHLFHSGFHQQHSEQPSGVTAALLSNRRKNSSGGQRKSGKNGGGIGRKGGRADKTATKGGKWSRWRKLSSRAAELTSRTEQLSLCPSSLLGLPPLTLAVSCSAGITAAAASVGVHVLQLDPPSSTGQQQNHQQNDRQHQQQQQMSMSASCSFLLAAPPTLPNSRSVDPFRRPSSESQMSQCSQQVLLEVPGVSAAASSAALGVSAAAASSTGADTKRASFLSLRADQPAEGRERPAKRISFNLPPLDTDELAIGAGGGNRNSKLMANGQGKKMSNGDGPHGIGQRLRRSFLLSLANRKAENASNEMKHEQQSAGKSSLTNGTSSLMNNGHHHWPIGTVKEPDCPAKALLKLQQRNEEEAAAGGTTEKKGTTGGIARALLAKLLVGRPLDDDELERHREYDSNGSGSSPQRKMCALRAETNFAGWAAYC